MKRKIEKSLMFAGLLGISSAAMSQTAVTDTTNRFNKKDFRTWSIGLNGGMLTHYTPFNNKYNGDFKTLQRQWGYGGYIKKQILPSFGIQADFLAGSVEGSRANSLPPGQAQDDSRFKTKIDWSAALSANFTVANMSFNHKRTLVSPYLTAGAGYMSYHAQTYNTPAGVDNGYVKDWFIPVGAGLKIGVAKALNLDFGYTVNFMKNNRFDGVESSMNDKFSYAHAGIEIAIGRHKSSQLQNYSPVAALREEAAAESAYLRSQLAIAEQKRMEAEQQRLADEQKMADAQAQYMRDLGDDDGDGVANKFDKCPGTPANTPVDGAGCPIKIPAPVVTEKVIVTEEDRKIVDEAIKNLEFDLGKSTIREQSYATLNKVAALLVQKNFSLKLAGHTDNTGSASANMELSKDRAESVKAYLVGQGANASRIEAVGYGQTQPIASNKTADGRQKNRRVEFTLY